MLCSLTAPRKVAGPLTGWHLNARVGDGGKEFWGGTHVNGALCYTLCGRMELHLQMASKGSLPTTLMDQRPVASLPSQNCVNLPKSLSCNTDNAISHSPRASLNLVFLLSMPSQAQGCKCQPEAGHPRLVCAARTPPWSPHSFTGLLFDIWPSH